MSNKYKQNAGGIFSAIGQTKFGKYAGRPFGFSKKIRTSTGVLKSFSRSARGKRFPIIAKLRTRSSKNLKTRLNYMNERIAGKTQKIEGYAFKLGKTKIKNDREIMKLKEKMKELGTTDPAKLAKYESKIANLEKNLANKTEKLTKKVNKAQEKLAEKIKRYSVKQKKYSKMLGKKIAKSQKRLENGFIKTCKNLRKKPGKSPIGCLDAYQLCKDKHGIDLTALTGCVNAESLAMGIKLDLKPGEVTGTMNKLAKKHFFNRFKQGRHLREIKRLKHGSELQKSINKSKGTLMYGERFQKIKGPNQFNRIGQLSKEKTIYQQLAKEAPVGTSTVELEREAFRQLRKGEILQELKKANPNASIAELQERVPLIYKQQKNQSQNIVKQYTEAGLNPIEHRDNIRALAASQTSHFNQTAVTTAITQAKQSIPTPLVKTLSPSKVAKAAKKADKEAEQLARKGLVNPFFKKPSEDYPLLGPSTTSKLVHSSISKPTSITSPTWSSYNRLPPVSSTPKLPPQLPPRLPPKTPSLHNSYMEVSPAQYTGPEYLLTNIIH